MAQTPETSPPLPTSSAVACTLPPAGLADVRAAWARLAARALRDSRATRAGVRQTYDALPEVERELAELVALEADCCAFATWQVTRHGDELVLEVTAEGAGATALKAAFGVG